MRIRQETPKDYAEVYELVKRSFATSTNDGECDYLNEVRQKDTFIPELSLVAEAANGRLVGQIVLYQTQLAATHGDATELLLSPICVDPDFFHRGIARSLMNEAFAKARELGYTAVFLCGEPAFYHRMGFQASYKFGIYHVADESRSAEWCMALELVKGSLANCSGTIDIV